MNTQKNTQQRILEAGRNRNRRRNQHLAHEAEGAASGMVLGAVVGLAAGPPGMIAGALIGGVSGALAAAGLEIRAQDENARTLELDEAIGVMGGEIGASNLSHPPASRGTFSAASSGDGATGGGAPAEGPMQSLDE
jgi:hypothetical protein